jgi:hypothetical protein
MTDVSKLAHELESGRFTVTTELVPPASADPEEVCKRAAPLKGLPTAVKWVWVDAAKAELSDRFVQGWELHPHGCSYWQAIPETRAGRH